MAYVPIHRRRDPKPLIPATNRRRTPTTPPDPPLPATEPTDATDLMMIRWSIEAELTRLFGAPTPQE